MNLWTVHKRPGPKTRDTAQLLKLHHVFLFTPHSPNKKETVNHFSFLISLAFILSEARLLLLKHDHSIANHHNRHLHHNRRRKRTITKPSTSSPSSPFKHNHQRHAEMKKTNQVTSSTLRQLIFD
jgi:hypothetical protein